MSSELPQILSDEEFAKLLKEREEGSLLEHDRRDNSGVLPPAQPSDGLPESCIEQQFPHIAKKLTVVWPSEACALYISELVVNKREIRQGFPPEVLEDLLLLHEINDMLLRGSRAQQAAAEPKPFSDITPRQQR